jgi:hypothetical protein
MFSVGRVPYLELSYACVPAPSDISLSCVVHEGAGVDAGWSAGGLHDPGSSKAEPQLNWPPVRILPGARAKTRMIHMRVFSRWMVDGLSRTCLL